MSGWLPLKADYPAAMSEAGKSMKYFHGHGDSDGVVKYLWGKHSAESLKGMGLDYVFKTYGGLDHGATPEEVEDVMSFLSGIVS
jgi:predicted esterase